MASGLDAQCCWLARRGLCLGWNCGLALGTRRNSLGASTTMSTSPSESSCSRSSEASPSQATRRRFLRGLVGVCGWRFPFLRGDTRGDAGEGSLFWFDNACKRACVRGRNDGIITLRGACCH
jgi:hypothetical protein